MSFSKRPNFLAHWMTLFGTATNPVIKERKPKKPKWDFSIAERLRLASMNRAIANGEMTVKEKKRIVKQWVQELEANGG